MAALRVTSRLSKSLLRSLAIRPVASYRSQSQAANLYKETPECRVTTLPNGFRIASENSGLQTATVGLWIDAGSRYESIATNGVAHFLEHMIFKGTAKRSQTDLELEVENMGAHLNAYTSREQTVYYAKCLSKDIPQAIDILADITQNSTFEPESIERERGVILREMEEIERNFQEVAFDYTHSAAYQGTELAMSILGPSENVKSITKQHIQDYISTHYQPHRMVLAGAGGVDHDALVKLATTYFGKMKPSDQIVSIPQTPKFTGSMIRHRDDDMPLAHCVIAVEGAGWDNPDNIPLMIANTIMGNFDRTMGGNGGLASRMQAAAGEHLHQRHGGVDYGVRTKELVHSYQPFNTCYKDTGLWGVYLVSEAHQVEDGIELVQDMWIAMAHYISDIEVLRARNLLKTNMLLMRDGSTAICEDIGRQMLCYGRYVPYSEWLRRIHNVTAADVQEVVYNYMYDREVVIAGIGPTEALHDYNWYRSHMWQVRK